MDFCNIVILNWNGLGHLQAFLPSVLSTVPASAKVTVADNGSADGSVDWLRANHPEVGLLTLDHNYGFAEGYDLALEKLDAKYFILLNSDVEPAPGWVGPLLEVLEQDEKVAAVAPKVLSYVRRECFEHAGACGGFIDYLGYPFCRGRILKTVERDHGQYDQPVEVFWATGACMAVRASAFRAAGGFDPHFFAHMEEIDLCWRLRSMGWSVRVEPRSTVYHLGGGTLPQESPRKTYLNYRNNLMMLYKNLPQHSLWPVMFARAAMDFFNSLIYLLTGRFRLFWAVAEAYTDFRRQRQRLNRVRAADKERVEVEPGCVYRGSILIAWLFGYRKFSDLEM